MKGTIVATAIVLWSSNLDAQAITQRGFIEGSTVAFPQAAPNDPRRVIGDVLFREEVFLRPSRWVQFAAGLDLRGDSHDQVEDEWRLDFDDRGLRRPRAAVRRLAATVTAGHFAVDIGKQFVRWGRADILNPTDRFAPRDYLNVIDSDFLPVLAVRPSVQVGAQTIEAVWVPQLTPSRMPLLSQRWAVLPSAAGVLIDGDSGELPEGSQHGIRWSYAGSRLELALSYFDGFNHLPNIEIRGLEAPFSVALTRRYPAIRTYGGDLALPTGWLTLKAEAAYFTSPSSAPTTDEYMLYVLEVERQVGEWILVVGYAGEAVRTSGPTLSFAADRGLARSILSRVAYTVDPRRTVAIESAIRQNGNGLYVKGEYSEAVGQYVRLTVTGAAVTGDVRDFLGQYRRNSHGTFAFRFSF